MTGPYGCDGLGSAHIIQGNALHLPLPDNSVDLICTSPPYFGLRSYQDAGVHYDGQIGSEATPAEFLDALLAASREMVRVLKPSGSIFVNLGDKYSTGASGQSDMAKLGEQYRGGGHAHKAATTEIGRRPPTRGFPPKTLLGIPWRYAIACIDQLGLILRAEIIWAKPNGLPESVTDRVRRSHEQWFHFVRQPRYFSAVDEIREPQDTIGEKHGSSKGQRALTLGFTDQPRELNPLGKLPGSVWQIPTQPLTVPPQLGIDHFAAFPFEFPRRIIQGWTPNGICTVCGEGRRPITSVDREHGWTRQTIGSGGQRHVGESVGQQVTNRASHTITGYTCACPPHGIERPTYDQARGMSSETDPHTQPPSIQRVAEMGASNADSGLHTEAMPRMSQVPHLEQGTCPAVVLDPFGGTGTTALVAKALGRIGITIDLSSDYCRLAEWRCSDPGQLAQALQIEKPEPISPDQLSLFGELA